GGQQVSAECTFIESDVQGGVPGFDSGFDNFDADPLFADPNDGDYHLTGGSPCVDAAILSNSQSDVDGNERGRLVDIGADEFIP
ncbi:MAG TPA: hypothetical protein VGO62_22225, partial [Myxococcota bacterium]